MYDNDNVFARILRAELPCEKIFEDVHVLSFYDIRPVAKVHALVVPKGAYVDLVDFCQKASFEKQALVLAGVCKVASLLNITDKGYRVIVNSGIYQEVKHLHWHIIGGESLGPMNAKFT